MSTKRKIHIPSDAEDKALTLAARADADNPPAHRPGTGPHAAGAGNPAETGRG